MLIKSSKTYDDMLGRFTMVDSFQCLVDVLRVGNQLNPCSKLAQWHFLLFSPHAYYIIHTSIILQCVGNIL